ncbi:unnamed protein product [Ilex paraguariensis]|uniref:Uncharacterized protein n=1 Tax=Ilex paraguariensis TaxID=185542 RepID=A0ABC8TUC2_9AQUA
MANSGLLSLLFPLLLAALVLNCHCNERKVHIVYMGERPQGDVPISDMHHSMLENAVGRFSLQANCYYEYYLQK